MLTATSPEKAVREVSLSRPGLEHVFQLLVMHCLRCGLTHYQLWVLHLRRLSCLRITVWAPERAAVYAAANASVCPASVTGRGLYKTCGGTLQVLGWAEDKDEVAQLAERAAELYCHHLSQVRILDAPVLLLRGTRVAPTRSTRAAAVAGQRLPLFHRRQLKECGLPPVVPCVRRCGRRWAE